MSNDSKDPKGLVKYIISTLVLKCCRAFQCVQNFKFFKPKYKMLILAPNSFGKTGIVDGLEFINRMTKYLLFLCQKNCRNCGYTTTFF